MTEYFEYQGKRFVEESSKVTPLYRVKHDMEIWGHARDKVLEKDKTLPEVFPLFPNQFTKLTCPWQRFWRNANPLMTDMEWRKLLYDNRAFTNNHGFEAGIPRWDCINIMDVGSEFPAIESLVCGGAILASMGDVFYKGEWYIEVVTLDGNGDPPSVEQAKADGMFFEAISVSVDGSTQSLSLTPYPEYVPIIANILPALFPKSLLIRIA